MRAHRSTTCPATPATPDQLSNTVTERDGKCDRLTPFTAVAAAASTNQPHTLLAQQLGRQTSRCSSAVKQLLCRCMEHTQRNSQSAAAAGLSSATESCKCGYTGKKSEMPTPSHTNICHGSNASINLCMRCQRKQIRTASQLCKINSTTFTKTSEVWQP